MFNNNLLQPMQLTSSSMLAVAPTYFAKMIRSLLWQMSESISMTNSQLWYGNLCLVYWQSCGIWYSLDKVSGFELARLVLLTRLNHHMYVTPIRVKLFVVVKGQVGKPHSQEENDTTAVLLSCICRFKMLYYKVMCKLAVSCRNNALVSFLSSLVLRLSHMYVTLNRVKYL